LVYGKCKRSIVQKRILYFYRVVLIAIGYVIFMFTIVRWLISRAHAFFVKRNDEMNRTFLICIFLILLASSFFCESLGIHSFFGAFIAGIICPKSGQFRTELYPKLELVTVQLLLPLFFAASGTRTSLGSLNDKFYGGITVLIFVIATLAKFLPGCFVTKIVTRRPWKFSIGVGILMNTRGLVELIALNIGLQLNILSPRLFTMLIIMALVTTFMTCPLLWLVYLRKYKPEPFSNVETDNNEKKIPIENDLPSTPVSPVNTRF
jgi:Kef-type K+ transport system membrane component KefB